MRSTFLLAIAILLAVGVLFARDRLKLAFQVGATLYAILLVARFFIFRFNQTDQDDLVDLATILAIFAAIWLAAWAATTAILRYRARRPRG